MPNPSPSVFRTTKNNHNILQGVAAPDLRLTKEAKDNFDAWILKNGLRWTAEGGPLAKGGVDIAFVGTLAFHVIFPSFWGTFSVLVIRVVRLRRVYTRYGWRLVEADLTGPESLCSQLLSPALGRKTLILWHLSVSCPTDDPQMPGLIPLIRKVRPEVPIVYRSHIEIRSDLVHKAGSPQEEVWKYLWNNIQLADLFLSASSFDSIILVSLD